MDALQKVDGVKEPKSGRNKYYFDMKVLENKPLLPAQLRKVAKALEDYPFVSLEVQGLAGTVEKTGDAYGFTARGSGQKYSLQASDGLKKLVEAGKTRLTLAGTVTQKEDSGPVTLDVTDANETSK